MNQWGFWCLFGVYSYEIPCNRMKYRKTHKVRERALLHGFSCYEISQKTSQPLSNPVSRSTSEWTAFHSKSPAEWLGISHTAPSFLLSAKSHARLACSVAVACKATSPITTARCRYQLFADLCLAALEIHFVSPLQQEEYRARQRAMLFFIPSARELESFRFRMPTGGPTKGRGLLHNV